MFVTLVNKLLFDMAIDIEKRFGHLFAKTCQDPAMQECGLIECVPSLSYQVQLVLLLASYFLNDKSIHHGEVQGKLKKVFRPLSERQSRWIVLH